MKILIFIAIILLNSCTKPNDVIVKEPEGKFRAITHLVPNNNTLYYRVFLSNDKNAPDNVWVYAITITKQQLLKGNIFYFDFEGLVCNDILYADPKKPLYGVTQETIYGNITRPLNHSSININTR